MEEPRAAAGANGHSYLCSYARPISGDYGGGYSAGEFGEISKIEIPNTNE
ncbi:hypothetical protein [Lewinella cohaerens]|nr:hypothetical protein [Lewinella cohaerens]